MRSRQESLTVVSSNHERTPKVQTATAYLETLNPEQRRAVEHGAAEGLAAPPLLVIAGAFGLLALFLSGILVVNLIAPTIGAKAMAAAC